MTAETQKVGRQIQLPLRKAVEISVNALKNRFWRSVITASGIILGIAFLMSVFVSGLVDQGLLANGTPDIQAKLSTPAAEAKAQQIWLISLSLLVCVVGITNAMLMSVTERFREIGTMKCLGALDSLIRKLFFLEAAFQGLLGSLCGIVVGTAFALLRSLAKYGSQAVTTFPLRAFLLYAVAALVVGVIMAVVGAIFPASQAARMAPAEAMATEV
jgi:hypothetical protein